MLIKNEHQWPVHCQLDKKSVTVGRWQTQSWQWLGIELIERIDGVGQAHQLLELFRDERTDYRFNLSSQQPKLFLALDSLTNNDATSPNIACLTASQSVIACFMDTDYEVLSLPMPLTVQAWIEAFIGRHGELIEMKKKKRKGAGRANGN